MAGRPEVQNKHLPRVDSPPAQQGQLARYAHALIDEINRGEIEEEEMAEDEPLVEVEDLGDDAIRGRELEVSLGKTSATSTAG